MVPGVSALLRENQRVCINYFILHLLSVDLHFLGCLIKTHKKHKLEADTMASQN